jgi:hypothetical protein
MSEADGIKLHVDHVIPVAVGGHNDPDNLVASCADCNLGKSANLLDDPKLIGVDFEARAEVFEQAQKSLKRYQAYLKKREKFETDLVSTLLEPLKGILNMCPAGVANDFNGYWRFGVPVSSGELPPNYRDQQHFDLVMDEITSMMKNTATTTMSFLRALGPDEVVDSAKIAKAIYTKRRGSIDEISEYEVFSYFCGICQRKMRDMGMEVVK